MNQIILDNQTDAEDPVLTALGHKVCGPSDSTTTTEQFLKILRAAKPEQQIVFQLGGTTLVEAGYHVTEVKAVAYSTMDCDGVANSWKETIIQLWNPGDEPEREHMRVKKFLGIYDRVSGRVPVSDKAEVRFEYGDAQRPSVSFHVERLESREAQILIHLRAPVVTCKARDRKNHSEAAAEASCCR